MKKQANSLKDIVLQHVKFKIVIPVLTLLLQLLNSVQCAMKDSITIQIGKKKINLNVKLALITVPNVMLKLRMDYVQDV